MRDDASDLVSFLVQHDDQVLDGWTHARGGGFTLKATGVNARMTAEAAFHGYRLSHIRQLARLPDADCLHLCFTPIEEGSA